MTAPRAFQYARWDGTQEPDPFDPGALFDALADSLLAGHDLGSSLDQLMERGFDGLPGLRELLARLEDSRDDLLLERRATAEDVERLASQLREAMGAGRGADIDGELVHRLLGPGSGRDLARLQAIVQQLEATGYLRVRADKLELTPEGMRRIGRRALQELFAQLRAGRPGGHLSREPGPAGEALAETKQFEFGDPFRLDLTETLMNALRRRAPELTAATLLDTPRPRRPPPAEETGPPTPPASGSHRASVVSLSPDDFAVVRAERTTRCATVLLLDTSRSMLLRGCVAAAKKVAIALDALIRAAYPGDDLRIVGFADRARPLAREELVAYDFNQFVYGTNLQHGLMVARDLLMRERGATRQIILVTDGEPTAHFERGQIRFAYPPTFQTFRETLREVGRCTRERITINTFMLERSRYLTEFVEQMTRVNRGRAFYADPARLGEYVLVDYVANQRRRVS